MANGKQRKAARRAVLAGKPLHLDLDGPMLVELPWLEFGGSGQAETVDLAATVEAGRRAAAAELDVLPEQIEVEPE